MSSRKLGLLEHFNTLPDPRRVNHNTKRHNLLDIVVIAVLATICGADTWSDIEAFGLEKKKWLETFLELENGIPSHDTFGRVFSILDPQAFERCFLAWTKTVRRRTRGEVVAIDGKSARRAHGKGLRPIHLVNAFATESGIALGHFRVDEKSNEITAIPELLKILMLKGCIVTTDAMGTQGWIVKKIKEQGADYVLAVKGNQGRLHRDLQKIFAHEKLRKNHARTEERAHGRKEVRACVVTDDLSSIRDLDRWDGLRSVAAITDTRTVNGTTRTATRYFISSLSADAARTLSAVRAHWKVENSLHWSLDIAFREDLSRVRIGHAQQNLALIRKLALNLLRREHSVRGGIIGKRLRAGWNEDYLLKVTGVLT